VTEQYILLVEDREEDIELMLRSFKRSHLMNEIVVKRDGVEALEHLERAEAPALILTDINMPRMNGIALVAAIRKIDRLRYVPIVMLTSSSEEPDLLASYERGANSYVLKPVRFSDFTELMDRLGMYWLVLNEAPNRDSRPA
jgi:two-component system response regulator